MANWIKRGDFQTVEEFILSNLGVKSPSDLNEWFKRSYSNGYRIKGLHEAVEFAKGFLHEKVTIVGDYDADGVTATSILYMGLKEYGFTNVSYRIPLRFSEGFGINPTIIDEIDSGLIITCDNGIAGLEALKKAKSKGLSVIVTDHHEPVIIDGQAVLPEADHIIDPNAIPDSADFNGYCGAGIAYKFICDLFGFRKDIRYRFLTLAAIGTVADVMELREENYVLVRDALKILHSPELNTRGLIALVQAAGIPDRPNANDIGFVIGPIINASSRMRDNGAKYAVELLTFHGDMQTATQLAEDLVAVNNLRKQTQREVSDRVTKIITEENRGTLCPLTVYVPQAAEGIIGIIAGQLCEKYRVPAIVLTDIEIDGVTYYAGSARSCGDYNVKAALDRHPDLLVRYGGHAGAAGVTILPENFDALTAALNADAHGFALPDSDTEFYDLAIRPEEAAGMIDTLERYVPFGEGNPEPRILVDFKPVMKFGSYRRYLGSSGKTVKLNGNGLDAISFSLADEFKQIGEQTPLELIGSLSNNYYKGNAYPQLMIQAYRIPNI